MSAKNKKGGFSYKPYKPTKPARPEKFITRNTVAKTLEEYRSHVDKDILGEYLNDFIDGKCFIDIECHNSYDNDSYDNVIIKIKRPELIENPYYISDLKIYKKDILSYEKKIKEYNLEIKEYNVWENNRNIKFLESQIKELENSDKEIKKLKNKLSELKNK